MPWFILFITINQGLALPCDEHLWFNILFWNIYVLCRDFEFNRGWCDKCASTVGVAALTWAAWLMSHKGHIADLSTIFIQTPNVGLSLKRIFFHPSSRGPKTYNLCQGALMLACGGRIISGNCLLSIETTAHVKPVGWLCFSPPNTLYCLLDWLKDQANQFR